MDVDRERIESKIMHIKENMKKLRKFQEISREDFTSDYRNYDAAKYNLQTSIEAIIDISNHIISRENLGVPESNADSFKILAGHGIISKDKCGHLSSPYAAGHHSGNNIVLTLREGKITWQKQADKESKSKIGTNS